MTPTPPAPRKILVVMLRRIGDVLLTTPAARALKKLFPDARLDFLVEAPSDEVLACVPEIDRVVLYGRAGKGLRADVAATRDCLAKVRAERYDWVVDFMGNPRTAILTSLSGARLRAGPGHVSHRWAYSHYLVQSTRACYSALEKIRVLRSLGLSPDESDPLPRLALPEANRAWAERTARGLGLTGPFLGLVPASRRETRRWPSASYAALGRTMVRLHGSRVVVFWGPGEEALAREVASGIGPAAAVSPRTSSLLDLAGLLARASLVVTNCNGPKHLAVAVGTPTLTIHGSSDPVCWNPPDSPRHRVARLEELSCIGCRLNECPYGLECMRQLSPERVARLAEEMLASRSPA